MATEAELLANIAALESALARGERTVQFENRSVTYATGGELIERIDYFSKQLRDLQGGRRRQTFGVASKGF